MTDTAKVVVSIVTPVFNRARLVIETLDSLTRQTFRDWEAVVVDDGSTDDTPDAVKRRATADARVRVVSRNRLPKGSNTCRNIGLAEARGEYVIFLDSDDLLAPACLQQRVDIMRADPLADVAIFQGVIFNQAPGDSNQVWNVATDEPDLYRFLRGDSVWQTAGPIWKKSVLDKIGGWDEQLPCWQDVDLHVRALRSGLRCVKRFDLPADYHYRWHTGPSISQGRCQSAEHIAGFMKYCAKVAVAPGVRGTPGETEAVRQVFARMIFLALDNMHVDLAEQGIQLAIEHGVAAGPAKVIWPAVCASYKLRTRGIRGLAWVGERIFTPYLPPPDKLFHPPQLQG